jgi:histidinol-phosphate phosphatase family protein
MRKAVFMDRDGTLNPDPDGYIDRPERFNLYENVADSIKNLNDWDFLTFVITNQSGIARGYYTFDDLAKVHDKFIKMLNKKNAFIDEILVSPYHKEGKVKPWNIDHEDRKPRIGLFRKVLLKHDIDKANSFMIGDKMSDIIFGKKCGLQTILVLTGNGKQTFQKLKDSEDKPDFVCKNFKVAVDLIKKIEDQ